MEVAFPPMSKRDPNQRTTLLEAFAICVVIAGVAIIIFATGRTAGVDVGRNEVSAREHYEAVKNTALAACIDTEPSALRQCVIKSTETAQNQSESRQDLYAQQDMSRWAFWMMIISGCTLLITGLGIVWIRDTLVETRRAVKAADDAVKVTRDIGEAQIRPYISIEHASAFVDERNGICFKVKVKNSGQTPARNVHVIVSAWVNRPCNPPDGFGGKVIHRSIEIFSRPLHLGDIPAQSVEGHGLHQSLGLSFPVDSVRTKDGCIQAGAGNIGVFAKDAFDNEIFEFGRVMVATGTSQYSQWLQAGEFNHHTIVGSFGDETAMRGRGWKEYNYQSHQLPWEDKPVKNLE